MASIADITVKKADGTTNVTYVAATPSAGDKSPAIWTQNAASGIQGFRPRFELQTQFNGTGDKRQVRFRFSYPVTYTEPVSGLPRLLKSVDGDGVIYMPRELSTTDWKEAFAQLGNLLSSTAARDTAETGFAPT